MGKAQSISAVINGMQRVMLRNTKDGSYVTTFETSTAAETVNVGIELSGKPPRSPKDVGLSQDDRTLTYFLKSVELSPV